MAKSAQIVAVKSFYILLFYKRKKIVLLLLLLTTALFNEGNTKCS